MYFVEFGDGFVATTAQAAHIVDARSLTARLTVVLSGGRPPTALPPDRGWRS
jgi:hypothetical protein